jgi:hypothetical protein
MMIEVNGYGLEGARFRFDVFDDRSSFDLDARVDDFGKHEDDALYPLKP